MSKTLHLIHIFVLQILQTYMFQCCCIIFRRMSVTDTSFSQSAQTGSKAHLVSCPKDTGKRFVQLSTHLYVVSRFRIHGSITAVPHMDLITWYFIKDRQIFLVYFTTSESEICGHSKRKMQCFLVHTMKAYGLVEFWLHSLLTLPLGGCVWSTLSRGSSMAGKDPLYSLNIGVGRPCRRFGRFGTGKNTLPFAGVRNSYRLTQSLFTI